MKLTRQQQKVYNFILANRGCTTHDIQAGIGVECPSARITEMRNAGVDIVSIGKKKYPGAHPFEMYSIGKPLTRIVSQIEIINGVAIERRVERAV